MAAGHLDTISEHTNNQEDDTPAGTAKLDIFADGLKSSTWKCMTHDLNKYTSPFKENLPPANHFTQVSPIHEEEEDESTPHLPAKPRKKGKKLKKHPVVQMPFRF